MLVVHGSQVKCLSELLDSGMVCIDLFGRHGRSDGLGRHQKRVRGARKARNHSQTQHGRHGRADPITSQSLAQRVAASPNEAGDLRAQVPRNSARIALVPIQKHRAAEVKQRIT